MNSIAPTPDVVDLDAPSGRTARAWASLVRSSTRSIPLDQPDPAASRCRGWCAAEADAAGRVPHPVAVDPDDRRCTSDGATVPLALHRGAEAIDSSPAVIPACLEVTVTQRHDEAEAVVELESRWWRDGPDGEDVLVESGTVRLRPAEVMHLVGTLVGAHDLAVEAGVR